MSLCVRDTTIQALASELGPSVAQLVEARQLTACLVAHCTAQPDDVATLFELVSVTKNYFFVL